MSCSKNGESTYVGVHFLIKLQPLGRQPYLIGYFDTGFFSVNFAKF